MQEQVYESTCTKLEIQLKFCHMSNKENTTPEWGSNEGLALEYAKPELKSPPMYTPMEFVVHILEIFFGMNREKATQIMLNVHTRGKGICGVYSRDIAETKVAQVNDYSNQNDHPLKCTMEAES